MKSKFIFCLSAVVVWLVSISQVEANFPQWEDCNYNNTMSYVLNSPNCELSGSSGAYFVCSYEGGEIVFDLAANNYTGCQQINLISVN